MNTDPCSRWITNDPKAGEALRKADRKFLEARLAAKHLSLAQKAAAFRHAKAVREADYALVCAGAYDRV